MPLSRKDAEEAVRTVRNARTLETARLNKITNALQPTMLDSVQMPPGANVEMASFADKSRTNYLPLILDVMSQGLFVEGYRAKDERDDNAAWDNWQKNRMDARQTGVHRAALAYGISYVLVLPGDDGAFMNGMSPKRMTALYQDVDQDEWPMMALHVDRFQMELYDETSVYRWAAKDTSLPLMADSVYEPMDYLGRETHGVGVCPVVRFRDRMLLDDETMGVIEPLIPIQSRIDETVFGLLTAQYYSAFRQRYVLGWEPVDAAGKPIDPMKAAASHLWTFADPDVTVGEFNETTLQGYLSSKDSAVKDLSSISQTPPQALLGPMANLSAEALAATEAGKDRKTAEIETSLGESWEQAIKLAGLLSGVEPDDSAQVRWRDSTARSLAQTVDALGKMVTMLGVPPEAAWERIPGATKEDVEHWKALASSQRGLGLLQNLIDQGSTAPVTTRDADSDGFVNEQ